MNAASSLKIALLALGASAAGCAATTAQVISNDRHAPTISEAQAAPVHGPQYRIAVNAFEFRASGGASQVGQGMTDMLTDALVNSGRFIVLERERLDSVTAEQDLNATNRFRQDTAAPIGALEGAQLLIRGSITSFEPNCKGGSILIASSKESCLAINLRIIDAATGRVVSATTVEGTAGSNRVGFIFAGGSLPVGLGAFNKTPMETAIRNAIEAAVVHIVNTKL